MTLSQSNVDYLNNNTSLYHSRAERTSYLATVINTNFVNGTVVAQAIFEFITGGQMSTNFVSPDAITTARFALNCQDPDIIVDLRHLNGRPRNIQFHQFWAMMAKVVEGRVNDRRHNELIAALYACCDSLYNMSWCCNRLHTTNCICRWQPLFPTSSKGQ